MSDCYDIYFGSHDHIEVRRCLRCSYHVIMFGGPLGDVPFIGVLCSVYKARCVTKFSLTCSTATETLTNKIMLQNEPRLEG